MEPTIFDHILTVILATVLPIYAIWDFGRLKKHVEAGVVGARMKAYRETMIMQWALALAVLVLWVKTGRGFSVLGLGFNATVGFWIGAALAVVACVLLIAQTIVVLRSHEKLEALREQVKPLQALLPHDVREGRTFAALSLTAGICEELLYRGFLIAYLAVSFDMWFAVLASSLVFGIGHSYQGGVGIVKTGFIGLAMAGLYLLTGSLFAPMILHAAVDLNSGYLARRVVRLAPATTLAAG